MRQTCILVIDSGIGGLSVSQNIRALTPDAHIDYLADLSLFPYGTKTENEITSRVEQLVAKSLTTLNPDIIVVACNTASTVALQHLRQKFKKDFIGVVPAIKPAAELSQSKIIGILATEGTINRSYTHDLIRNFAGQCDVRLAACSELVQLVENKIMGSRLTPHDILLATTSLANKADGMDTIVLACTHFPLVRDELRKAYPHISNWVDSGSAIARRVEYIKNQLGFVRAAPKNTPNRLLITKNSSNPYDTQQIEQLLGPFVFSYFPI